MWLTGRLAPDHKTIADFRKDNGRAIRQVCARFVELCRTMGLLTEASVAIDGSKFKAVNNRDRNFTRAKMERRMAQIEESVARYLQQPDTADRQAPSEALKTKTSRLKEKIAVLKEQMQRLEVLKVQMLAAPDQQISLTDPDARSMATSGRGSGVVGCQSCTIKHSCTTGKERRITRWEHEHILEAVQRRLDEHPEKMRQRRETVEHPFGTIKARICLLYTSPSPRDS